MRLLLINPSKGKNYRNASDLKIASRVFGKKFLAGPYALTTIAGLTPQDVEITIVDEEVEIVDYDFDADLVGITSLTWTANRAYQIADEFRKRGRHVVMGGIHASMLPDDALRHVDTVVVGEAEGVWDKVIEDFKNKRIKKLYKAEKRVDLNEYPIARRDLERTDLYTIHLVQTKRGCPYNCSFCMVHKFNGRKVRLVGPEKVRQEIEHIISMHKSTQAKYNHAPMRLEDLNGTVYDDFISLFLVDDNFIINKKHVQAICAMIRDVSLANKIKISWATQVDISVAEDDELLQLLSESGCTRLFIGFESLSDENLEFVNKNCKTSNEYSKAITKIYSFGMDIIASFVIGNDFDDAESLQNLVDFVEKECLFEVLLGILTPYPGTDLFAEFEKEGRILTKDWDQFSFDRVAFSPKKMTPDELIRVQDDLYQQIYGGKALVARLLERNKNIFQDKSNWYLNPSPSKWLVSLVFSIKALGILRRKGVGFKDCLSLLLLCVNYFKKSEKRVSYLTLNGFAYFIDKAHFLYWRKQQAATRQPASKTYDSERLKEDLTGAINNDKNAQDEIAAGFIQRNTEEQQHG